MRLVQGQQGELVAQLQVRLGMRPEGYFDAKTKDAVRQWQLANNLIGSGDVDEQTWEALFPPLPVVEQPVIVEPIVEQPTPKPVEEDGHKQDQAVTPEVNRILSGGGHKNTNRSSSYSR